jgi:hypothetical protein
MASDSSAPPPQIPPRPPVGFAAVVVLKQRIRWFGERTNAAQHHHAWVVFDHAHPACRPPALLYA